MRKKYAAAALVLVAVAVFPGAAAAPAGSSTVSASTNVKRLLLDETETRILGRHDFAGTELALSGPPARSSGFDTFTGHVGPDDQVRYESAFALKGGLLLVRLHRVSDTPRYAGRVTGGTGTYRGATGTLSGRDLGDGNTRLTLRYQL